MGTLRLGSSSTISLVVPSPLLPVQLTICCTSSFMHYQFTPTSLRVESCPAQIYSRVQGRNSKPFIMWFLPSGLQPLQNRLWEERKGEERRVLKGRKEIVLTCTMCASGSVLTVKDRRNWRLVHKQPDTFDLTFYHLFGGKKKKNNNNREKRWMQRTFNLLPSV